MSTSIVMPQGPAIFSGSMEVCVKNTFLDVVEDAATLPKRSSSLPPSIRLAGISHVSTRRLQRSCSDFLSEIDVSTEASEDDASSEVGSSSAGETASVSSIDVVPQRSGPTRLNLHARAWQPKLPCSMPSEQRLVTSSKPWKPRLPPPSPPGTRLFGHQFEQVLAMFKTILATCLWIDSVDVKETIDGFCIVVTVPVQHFHNKDSVGKLAKAALLQAAERSDSICVLGYQAKPFVTMPLGFAALLAAVPDEHTACWGMLQSGFCHYGNRCRWQHPCDQRKVNVKLMLPSF